MDASRQTCNDDLWKSEVRRQQQQLSELLYLSDRGHRAKFNPPSVCTLFDRDCQCKRTTFVCENDLKNQIAYALFKDATKIEKDDENKVQAICSCIEKTVDDANTIKLGFAFVFIRDVDVPIPVFRIFSKGTFLFIDENCRVYKNWEDYVKNNTLPKGDWCYPQNGIYSKGSNGVVNVEFGLTPASKLGRRIANVADYGATVLTLTAEITGTVCAFVAAPVVAPIAIGVAGGISLAAGVYSLTRSSVALHDKASHGESIGIKNRQALMEWASIAGAVVGAVGTGARVVSVLSKSAQVAKGAKIVSATTSAMATGFNSICTGDKILSNRADNSRAIYFATVRKVRFYFSIILDVLDIPLLISGKSMRLLIRALSYLWQMYRSGCFSKSPTLTIFNISECMLATLHFVYSVFEICLSLASNDLEKTIKSIKMASEKLKSIRSTGASPFSNMPNSKVDKILSKIPGKIGVVIRECYKVFCASDDARSAPDKSVHYLTDSFEWLNLLFSFYKEHGHNHRQLKLPSVESSTSNERCTLPRLENLYLFPNHLDEECNGELTEEFCKRIAQKSLELQNSNLPLDIVRTGNEIEVILCREYQRFPRRVCIRIMRHVSLRYRYIRISVY